VAEGLDDLCRVIFGLYANAAEIVLDGVVAIETFHDDLYSWTSLCVGIQSKADEWGHSEITFVRSIPQTLFGGSESSCNVLSIGLGVQLVHAAISLEMLVSVESVWAGGSIFLSQC
jgi:hypothetical protein